MLKNNGMPLNAPGGILSSHRDVLSAGMRVGIPIAMGYFVVSFTLGIAAHNAGLTPFQGFIASVFNNASAGEYAGFTTIAADAAYWEIALITLVANARYMLMSCVISQKLAPDTPLLHRIAVGFDLTDEIFGVSIARSSKPLDPYYVYGAVLVALPGWSIGTALGIIAGDMLPGFIVSALSVALYGMFIWIIIPEGKKNHIVAGLIPLSFAASYIASKLPALAELSASIRIIILTVVIAGIAAILFPVKENEKEAE